MKAKNKPKILVCMSGGVDSSVAAALLVQQGYDVTGMFAINYEEKSSQGVALAKPLFTGRSETKPCWQGDYQDALRVSAKLGIPLLRLNFIKEYKKSVLDYMYTEYKKGRTPNPDVLCNKFVKFGFWLKKAKELGFGYMATGHYARIQKSKIKNLKLVAAVDDNKDQTYFLHQLNQSQLKYTMFPIGGYTKDEVRKLADKFDLPTAKKEESMGICFIGEVPMKEFLQKKIKTKKGKIILNNSKEVLGEHEGIPFYTIGQRLGLNNKPYFVVKKDVKKNILFVGYENDPDLMKNEIEIENANWISGQKPKLPLKCEVRLRHRQPLQQCHCEAKGRGNLIIKFSNPQKAATPGQFAVFYTKGMCLGGGTIK